MKSPLKVHGLVLYTISDNHIRDQLKAFIESKLNGIPIDQSTYALRQTGDTRALALLRDYVTGAGFVFNQDDYIRICFSVALVDNQPSVKDHDQIYLFSVIGANPCV